MAIAAAQKLAASGAAGEETYDPFVKPKDA